MNILVDALPDYVTCGDVKYGVYTDFRIWMEFDRIMHLNDTSTKDKFMMVMRLCFDSERCKIFPENAMEAMDALARFFLCEKTSKDSVAEKREKILDFSEDSGYIYSAFLTQYGIDLLSIPYLHWYIFCALLEGLEETRELMKIMRFRVCDPEKAQNPEKRNYLRRMKRMYALCDARTKEERDEDVAKTLLEVF